MKNFFSKFLLLVFILAIASSFYYLYQRVEELNSRLEEKGSINTTSSQTVDKETPSEGKDSCGQDCKEEIAKAVSQAVATLSGTKVVTTIQSTSTPKTSYINLGLTHSTMSTGWVTIDESGVYIDLENEYGKGAKVSWEASLKVDHGNGKAYARLYDDTNKIAVDFGEISTENNAAYKLVSTGDLPFWRGRNLYKLQLKSLNSFEVTYTGGRIKIRY